MESLLIPESKGNISLFPDITLNKKTKQNKTKQGKNSSGGCGSSSGARLVAGLAAAAALWSLQEPTGKPLAVVAAPSDPA